MAVMGDNFQVLEIVVFAVIAGILVFRLRSVLGRRTGNERRRDLPFSRSATPANPVPPAAADAAAPRLSSGADVADSAFDSAAFLSGARGAFEIIVAAFAAGDQATLQPLLSPDVFRSFSDAIAARERAKEKQETKIVAIKSADIVQNRVEGGTALVTVKFVSDQILVTRDAAGTVLEGDPNNAVEHTDLWTFSRPTRSPDPNWTLIATETPPPA
jgi:predicted lipid-binding transport protein (Tim44 family)